MADPAGGYAKTPAPVGTDGVDPELHELQMQVHLIEQWQFQSPILPPAILKQYEEIIPDFAERYFAAWERQGAHRQRLESTVVAAQTRTQLRAQPYTFALGALALLVAGALGLAGEGGAAVAVVALDFTGLGGVFVYGRISNVREARRKEEAVPDPGRTNSRPPERPAVGRGSAQRRPQPQPKKKRKKRRR